MPRVVILADFRPSPRADELPWTEARIEETDDPAGEWEGLKTVELDPVDEDPLKPIERTFTVAPTKEWLRVVFLDAEGGEDDPSPVAATSGVQFRPTVAQVSAVLRARTYMDAEDGLVGGALAGEFNSDTTPTAEDLEGSLADGKVIAEVCVDVAREVGRVPGFLLDDARRLAALGAAKEIERSYLPEQVEPDASIYQTLRLTYEEKTEDLRRRLQWWVLVRHGAS